MIYTTYGEIRRAIPGMSIRELEELEEDILNGDAYQVGNSTEVELLKRVQAELERR